MYSVPRQHCVRPPRSQSWEVLGWNGSGTTRTTNLQRGVGRWGRPPSTGRSRSPTDKRRFIRVYSSIENGDVYRITVVSNFGRIPPPIGTAGRGRTVIPPVRGSPAMNRCKATAEPTTSFTVGAALRCWRACSVKTDTTSQLVPRSFARSANPSAPVQG